MTNLLVARNHTINTHARIRRSSTMVLVGAHVHSTIVNSSSPLVSWLQSLDSRWRGYFLRVAKGDGQAKFELIATLPLWWDGLPASVRDEIDARIEAWSKDRSRTEVQIATRRVLSLIPRLRGIRGDLTALSAAARRVI